MKTSLKFYHEAPKKREWPTKDKRRWTGFWTPTKSQESQFFFFDLLFTFGIFPPPTIFGATFFFFRFHEFHIFRGPLVEVETWAFSERGVFSSFQALNDRLGNAQQPTGLGLLVGIPSFEKPFFSR